MENRAKKFAIPIISLFLLVLATGAYGENDDQPKWDATIFGAWVFGEQIYFGTGGAVGYSFTSGLQLEGEVYTMFLRDPPLYGVSGALLYNFQLQNNKLCPYILGGVSALGAISDRGGMDVFLMFGGGMKLAIQKEKNYRIRFDLRWHPAEDGWMRVSIGLMWLFR